MNKTMSQNIVYFTLLLFAGGVAGSRPPSRGGGWYCGACTFAMAIVDQQAQYHNESIGDALKRVCSYFPIGKYNETCETIIEYLTPVIIDLFYFKLTPDHVCHALGPCYDESPGPQCHLFPEAKDRDEKIQLGKLIVAKFARKKNLTSFPDFCEIPGVKFFCDLFERVFKSHKPAVDLDRDGFSTVETLRGSSWKGRDCSPAIARFHPGAKPFEQDVEFDSNCNGIFGVNPETLTPYEEEFCANSGQMGSIILGDSASAHFRIPSEWIIPNQLNAESLAHLPFVVENEVDWPMMSAMTGFKNITWPIVDGHIYSFYQRMRDRNHCNHRDYQNLCVNGDDSFDLLQHMDGLARHPVMDHPAFTTIALVGNDVCNGFPDTISHMTTPQEMTDNIIKALHFLDKHLPNGSHVLLVGLADGRYLYELLYDRYHPFGQLNRDVKYPDFYSYLSCLQVSPCNGWMTTNATLRNYTTQRAEQLSAALSVLAKKYHNYFRNFPVNYIDCPITQVLQDWEKKHGKGSAYELIEKVDGFHPNTMAESKFAEIIYQYLEKHLPQYLGPVNPHNDRIRSIFGDQGGY